MHISQFFLSQIAIPICWVITCIASAIIGIFAFDFTLQDAAYWGSIAAAPGIFGMLFDRVESAMQFEILIWIACGGWIMAASGGLAGPCLMMAMGVLRPCASNQEDLAAPAACTIVIIALLAQYAILNGWPEHRVAVAFSPLITLNAIAMLGLYAVRANENRRLRQIQQDEVAMQIKIRSDQKQDMEFRVSKLQESVHQLQYERDTTRQQLIQKHGELTDNENFLRFLTGVARRMQTMLSAMIGFSEELHKAPLGPMGKHYNEYAQYIKEGGQQLQVIINGMDCLYKVASHSYQISPNFVSLKDVAGQAFVIMAPEARKRGIQLSQMRGHDVEIYADPSALQQILLCMVSASLERTPRGGQIILWARQSAEGRCLLGIQDSGTGMTTQDILQTANFTGLEKSKTPEGLGLTVARVLIDLHGGTLGADSDPQKGNAVWVQFPAGPTQHAAYLPMTEDAQRLHTHTQRLPVSERVS